MEKTKKVPIKPKKKTVKPKPKQVVKKDPVKKEPVKKEPVKKEPVKKDPVKKVKEKVKEKVRGIGITVIQENKENYMDNSYPEKINLIIKKIKEQNTMIDDKIRFGWNN